MRRYGACLRLMRSKRIQPAWRAALVVALPALTAAHAGAATEAIRIDYRAPQGCPSAERFVDDVLARAGRARLARGDEPARTFVIAIVRDGAAFDGSLAIREPASPATASTETVARKVTSARCDEVAEALALSTALAVDPAPAPAPERASSPESGTESGAEPTPSAAESSRSETKSDPSPDAAKPRPEPARSGEPSADEAPSDVPEREPEPAAQAWSYWVGLGPALRTGASPDVAFGGAVSFDAMAPSSTAILGLDVAYLRGPAATVDGASSSFGFLLARPRACFAVARLGRTLGVGPCLGGELGAVHASGSELPRPETQRRFWAAAALALRIDARLSARLRLDLNAGVALTLTRYRFVFLEPETSIYDVPALGLVLGVALGARAF